MGGPRYFLLVGLTAAGLVISAYLVWQHAHFLFTGQTGGVCSLVKNTKFDCTQTENSAFSEFMGIPTASFGLFYFLAFLAYLVGFRPSDPNSPEFRNGASAINAVGIAVSITLGSIATFVIKSLCIGCVLVYSVNLLILLTLMAWRRFWMHPVLIAKGAMGILPYSLATLRVGEERARSRAKLALVLLALVAAINFYAVPKFIKVERMRIIITGYDQMPVMEIPVHPWNIAKGESSAPIQIVKFTDFQCPTCQRAAHDLESILADFDPSTYRIVYKNFPLDRKCNRLVSAQGPDFDIHPGSCHIALLAQGAGSMDGFWKAVGLFYAMKDYTGRAATDAESMKIWFGDITAATGLDETAWLDLSRAGVTQQRVMTDIEDGARLMLTSTPAIFVNGRRAPGAKYADLKAILDHVAQQ